MKTRLRSLYTKAKGLREKLLSYVEKAEAEQARWLSFFKTPYRFANWLGFSPRNVVIAAIAAGTAGGVTVAVMDSGPSFSRGDPGVYDAPGDIPVVYSDSNNTLRVDLGTTPVGEIIIEDVSVGSAYTGGTVPSGEANVIIVGGLESAQTYIEVGHFTIDRWRCTKLTLRNIDTHILNMKYNSSDGQSDAHVGGTARARGIGGGNRADIMSTSGGNYDLVKIRAPTSGTNGKVDVLTMSNIQSKGGNCVVERMKIGTLDVLYNEIGSGDGFGAKDFIIDDTVNCKVCNIEENVEVSISPP